MPSRQPALVIAGPCADPLAARNALASAIRSAAMGALGASGIPHDVADDLAQKMVPVLLARIEEGGVASGREAAYVRASVRNRARDYFREQSGVRCLTTLGDAVDEIPAPPDSAEQLLVELEEAEERAIRLARIRYLVSQAPSAYRRVLEHVYVQARTIDELVTEELVRRGAAGADVAERRRARAVADKTLQRARDWVRERLAAGGTASATTCAPRVQRDV